MSNKDNLLTQVSLYTKVLPRGQEKPMKIMTTWIDADPRIKKGVIITLKGDDREWVIDEVYNTEPKHTIDNHGWDNNNYDKHDGTALKDRIKK